jgi:hypothetical protein
MSNFLEVMFADYPSAPQAPVKIDDQSSLTSIALSWSITNEGDELKVKGYKLWMDSGSDGKFVEVFDGQN